MNNTKSYEKPFNLTEAKKYLKLILTTLPLIALILCSVLLWGCAEEPSSGENGDGALSDAPPITDTEPLVHGYILRIDGADVAFVENESDVNTIIDILCSRYSAELTEKGIQVESVKLSSTLETETGELPSSELKDAPSAANGIASSGSPLRYSVTETVIQSIDFSTVRKNSSSYYEGTEKIQTEGEKGEKRLTYSVEYTGSTETSRVLSEEKTVKAATDRVILVGTKKSTASTGSYAWPTKSVYITSYYGWRTVFGKREYHYGIDLRAAVGTAIYAADGGKVIFAGTASGYGKLIKIQHDNGDLTYYAHLNSFSVKAGDRVYKGQLIAKSGKTGRVTGPHLHFEIRKNGVRVNPVTYLPKL